MASQPDTQRHIWYTPADCAAMLDATQHGKQWRSKCPVHGGDNTSALQIAAGRDSHGNPVTLLHCHAHQCSVEDICAAMGVQVRNLFAIHPDYAKATRNAPRVGSPRINRLKTRHEPLTEDEMAQIMLEEMIVSDPAWIEKCAPARAKMWELAQASPKAHDALTRALRQGRLIPSQFWARVATEMESTPCN